MKPLRIPWWIPVFVVALALRLGFLFLVDEPLLFRHSYNYFNGGLSIAEHPDPVEFVLRSETWRTWNRYWTIAPLYYLVVAGVFKVFGPHLAVLLGLQCVLDSVTAVLVGILGRSVAGPRGIAAGFVYAVCWRAVELSNQTMTENAHTFLLATAMALLVRWAGGGMTSIAHSAVAGALLGLSALARAVSLAFVPLAGLWHLWAARNRRSVWAMAAFVLAAAAAVLPWTARNVFLIGDPHPIESVSIFNLWVDNSFVDEDRLVWQENQIGKQATPAARRAKALHFVRRGLAKRWTAIPEKIRDNLAHFLRFDGLHVLLRVEEPRATWRYVMAVLLDDGVLAFCLPLAAVFLAAGPPSPARRLILLWTVYYLFMVVVVFHNDVRYRSAWMPLAIPAAVAGACLLARPEARRLVRAWIGLGVGLLLLAWLVRPYAGPAWNAARACLLLRPARAAVERGDLAEARRSVLAAAAADPVASRPWATYGRWLLRAGFNAEALDAFTRALERRGYAWGPRVLLPRALAEAGRSEEAARAVADVNAFSQGFDPWLVLETAWRDLPPPRTNAIRLGQGDYGAVRHFFQPLGDHRWSRGRALLRLVPIEVAGAYDVTIEMGSPPPSPRPDPEVTVTIRGGARARFRLTPEVRSYTLRTPAPPDGVVLVELVAPTWSRVDHTAEQGVRVNRMVVTPVGAPQ